VQGYIVECYVPKAKSDEFSAVRARARAAAQAMTREGTPVRHLRSILIPEDETCFHVFEGPSAEVVGEVSRRAELTYDRIVEAVE
jgi:Protein of unknown function (DUF4242)